MNVNPNFRARLLLLVLLANCGTASADSSLQEIDDAIAVTDYDLALELLDSRLAANPDDVSLLLRYARVHSYVGNFDTALNTLDQLRETYPHDVDYALARAQVLARQGRDNAALADLRNAAVLAPDYEEVWRLRYRLLLRQENQAARLERESLSNEAAIRFPHAAWWRATEKEKRIRWTLLAGAAHENLSNSLPSWNRQFIEISRAEEAVGHYRFGIARDARFNNSDTTISLGGDRTFASVWTAGLDITVASKPDFQPDLSMTGNVGRKFSGGWVADLRYRHREYESATVGAVTGTFEKYADDFRFAYALGVSRLQGSSSFMNHGLTVNWYYSERSSIGITVSTGKEAESIGPGQVLETDVQGISVSGRRQLSDRFGLQWWLGSHEQGDFYRRQYFGMAVSIQL